MQDISWAIGRRCRTTWDDVQQRVSSPVRSALEKVLRRLMAACSAARNVCCSPHATGDDLFGLVVAANELRRQLVGDVVSYVVTRNINFTNVCFVGCKFCAFSVGPRDETAYFLSLDEVADKVPRSRAVGRDRSLHPGRAAARSAAVLLSRHSAGGEVGHAEDARHAFSPMEMVYGVELTGMPMREYLLMLKDNGLDTLPGTAAEILDDERAPRALAQQAEHGAMARGDRDGARVRHPQHLDHDVRPLARRRSTG